MNIIHLQSTDSTNRYLRDMPEAADGTVVACHTQTCGRGQRGNSWEAEPGANLTFSMLFRPRHIDVQRQFAISRAVAIAIAETLRNHWLEGLDVKIKWPNDIYVDDRKIGGILIEHSIDGSSISRTIIGVGLNFNQTRFISDAPNPVSVKMLTGADTDLSSALAAICGAIFSALQAEDSGELDSSQIYRSMLWRGDGYHPYEASGERFEAAIHAIDPMGRLTLRLPDGSLRSYWFKEVAAII